MSHLISPLKQVIQDYSQSSSIVNKAEACRLSDALRVMECPQNFSREDYALAVTDARRAVREYNGNDSH